MLEIKARDKHSPLTLIITGDVSVTKIGELYAGLLGVSVDVSECLIRIEKIENLDLSFFQVLFAFVQKLKTPGKKLNFEWDLDEEYQRIMDESGFLIAFNELLSI